MADHPWYHDNPPPSRGFDTPRQPSRLESQGTARMEPHVAATIEFTPSDVSSGSNTYNSSASQYVSDSPRVEMVVGPGPRLAHQTAELLKIRLRAVAIIFLVGHLVFFARNLLLPIENPSLPYVHGVVILTLGGIVALLYGRASIPLRSLRHLELFLFGAMAAFFAFTHYRMLLDSTHKEDPLLVLTTVKNTLLYNYMLILTYGLFIPNTWKRTAVVVGVISILPAMAAVLMEFRHSELLGVARPIITFASVSDNVLIVLLGDSIAIYGSHVMNTLRVEAFEARQLGQYRLLHKLGQGGMGEVYLAEHQLFKRPCAVKLIHAGRAADPRALARFEREVRTTAHLSHPNTVEIYDYGRTEDGAFYYVMEYLHGLSLAELVERHGPLPPGRVIYLLRQACGALAEAHAAGLVHRDIKPANIFASRRGGCYDFVKLLDFGLVKAVTPGPESSELSREGSVTGSPLYMSPEQATGERDPDRRADIYSLGGVGYYLLTGRPPFAGSNAMQVMIAHARDPVPSPSSFQPGIPSDLESVLLKCLGKAPSERYPTANALDAALAACEDASRWDARKAEDWWRSIEPVASSTPIVI